MKQVEITSKVVGRGESEGITSAIPSINLSGFALKSDLLTLEKKFSDFLNVPIIDGTINRWNELETFLAGISEDYNLLSLLNGKADKSYVDTNFVTIAGTEDVTGLHNFVNGLKIGGIELIQKNGNAFLKGNLVVEGGITMYGDGEGGSSAPLYSTLGSLLNVDESNDAVASVDRVLFQSAGSNVWSWKALSEIGGGSSGGSVSGDYLPLANAIYHTRTQNPDPNTKYDNWMGMSNKNTPDGANYYHILSSTWDNMYWSSQLAIPTAQSSNMYYRRGASTSSYNSWVKLLDANNYSSYALPLSGGTINGAGDYLYVPLFVNALNNQISGITFQTNGTERGHIGYHYELGMRLHTASTAGIAVSNSDVPIFYTGDGSVKNTILHSGNYSSYALPLSGGTVIGNIRLQAPGGNNPYTALELAGSNTDLWQISGRFNKNSATENNKLDIYYYNGSTYASIMTLQTNGNVGIGTTSPTYKLEVVGKTGIFDYTRIVQLGEGYTLGKSKNSDYAPSGTIFHIVAKENNVSSAALIAIDTTHTNTQTNSIYLGGVNSGLSNGASNFVIGRRTGVSTWTESLRIDANGNVGIGTTSPSQKLHVEGYVRIGENFIASGSIGFNRNTVVGGRFNNSYNGWQFHIDQSNSRFYVYTEGTNSGLKAYWDTSGNYLVYGGITMYSDQRKKTKLQDVELSLSQIANAPLIQHYYNSDQNKTTHVGSIAQYWASMNNWFCKKDAEGFYTMEIQNCALASAISIARHLEKYESKTDKTIRKMKKRIQELEDEVERLKQN